MEGSGAEHVRLRLSTGMLGPPWQEPEQGPQGPQAAQAPCAVVGWGGRKPTVVMHAEVLPPWQFPAITLRPTLGACISALWLPSLTGADLLRVTGFRLLGISWALAPTLGGGLITCSMASPGPFGTGDRARCPGSPVGPAAYLCRREEKGTGWSWGVIRGPCFLRYPISANPVPASSVTLGPPSLLIWTTAVTYTLILLPHPSSHRLSSS